MIRRAFSLLCVMCFAVSHAAAQTPLCNQISALTQGLTVAAAHWGVMVATLDGTPLCGLNEAQFFRPASNNKLFTAAAAFALLGEDKRFTTKVVAEGKIAGGRLRGNLLLRGGGDANFGAQDLPYVAPAKRPRQPPPEPATIADIEELADKIYATGLRVIDGDIIGDDTWFEWEPYPPDWAADDLIYGYGAPVSGLTIHDNQQNFAVAPDSSISGRAIVSTTPGLPFYQVDASVFMNGSDGGCDDLIGYSRDLGSKRLSIFGTLRPNFDPCRQAIAISDPAEFAAIAFKAALLRRGVKIRGAARPLHHEMKRTGPVIRPGEPGMIFVDATLKRPHSSSFPGIVCQAQQVAGPAEPKRTVLATHESPPLADDVTYTLKVSQNLHAEILMRNLGAAYDCEHTQSAGAAVVREFLLHAGIERSDLVLYDGSGLSGHDLTTPRALAKVLAYASTQPWFTAFQASLPIGGVDGSIATRFSPPDSALKGRVFAKTGTLSESRALSGYVAAASGQTIIFSVLVDDHQPSTSADRKVMDQIVELIAAQN